MQTSVTPRVSLEGDEFLGKSDTGTVEDVLFTMFIIHPSIRLFRAKQWPETKGPGSQVGSRKVGKAQFETLNVEALNAISQQLAAMPTEGAARRPWGIFPKSGGKKRMKRVDHGTEREHMAMSFNREPPPKWLVDINPHLNGVHHRVPS